MGTEHFPFPGNARHEAETQNSPACRSTRCPTNSRRTAPDGMGAERPPARWPALPLQVGSPSGQPTPLSKFNCTYRKEVGFLLYEGTKGEIRDIV